MTRHPAIILAVALSGAPAVARSAPWAQEVGSAPVIMATASWTAGQTHVVELVDVTGDPVVHVFRADGSRVAWSSGVEARLELTVHQTGTYDVVVHAGASSGVATLTIDALPVCRACRFDAAWAQVPAAPAWTDYRYETVRVAGGTDDTLLLGFGADRDPSAPVAWDDDSGRGLMAALRGSAVHWLLVGTAAGRPGATLLYANDYRDDADGDGLGAQLERYGVATCDARTLHYGTRGVPCLEVDPTDSDGDGIPDGEEILGYAIRGPLLADPAAFNLSAVARTVAATD